MVTYLVIHPWVMLQGNKRSHGALLVNPSVWGGGETPLIQEKKERRMVFELKTFDLGVSE